MHSGVNPGSRLPRDLLWTPSPLGNFPLLWPRSTARSSCFGHADPSLLSTLSCSHETSRWSLCETHRKLPLQLHQSNWQPRDPPFGTPSRLAIKSGIKLVFLNLSRFCREHETHWLLHRPTGSQWMCYRLWLICVEMDWWTYRDQHGGPPKEDSQKYAFSMSLVTKRGSQVMPPAITLRTTTIVP